MRVPFMQLLAPQLSIKLDDSYMTGVLVINSCKLQSYM